MPDDSRILRIGEWRVDPDLDELSREGQTIRLEPRPMRLLLYLAAHAGRVVDVQQLLDEVWPNVIVTHGSVYQAIAQLRRILGDESGHPKYIENLPRLGYRLIAPVAPWDVRCAAPTESNSAAQSFIHMVNGSVAAEARLASGAPEAVATLGIPDSTTEQTPGSSLAPVWWSKLAFGAIGAVLAAALAYLAIDKFWISKPLQITSRTAPAIEKAAQSTSVTVEPAGNAFNPPPHSIAVLPFVNMSGDASQEYFSDGLSEELINALSRINELQVAARTSAFSFKGTNADLGTIGHKLNVASVLEGSVRRSGHRIRVTAQLNNAVTGFHVWSQTYDRELSDVLKLQTEIASAVASALEVTLLRDVGAEMKVGGTRNPAAYDTYLRAASAYWQANSASEGESARAGYQEAVRLDPNFALAYAEWSIALHGATQFAHGPAVGDFNRQARAPALTAVALAPELAEGHLALAIVQLVSLDFAGASDEFQRAMTLAPGNTRVLRDYSAFAGMMGRTDAGIAAARRAAALDPLNDNSYTYLSGALLSARRYDEALAAYQDGLSLRSKDPTWPAVSHVNQLWNRGQLIYYALGDFEKMRALCEGVGQAVKDIQVQDCLALAYHKLGRQADAETALARFKALEGNAGAYGYATIYAQWGNTPKALEWLETALQLRDPQLRFLKSDSLLDPLRQEPRFKAIERELKFPSN
jgi:TolB-like protein/DNA-binding winged helix-turn-helix (wHTH) protein